MKKNLLSLIALCGFATMNADEISFDFVNNEYGMTRMSGSTSAYNPDPTTVKDGAVEINLTGNTRLWSDGLRFYKGGAMEISAPGYVITGVTINTKSASDFNKFNYDGIKLTSADWTGNEASVKFACNITSKNVAVKTLVVTYELAGNPDKKEAGLSFAESNFQVRLSEGFTAPELINPNNLAVTYSSSEEGVATVAADGKVTLVGPGTTKITASSEETEEFNAGSAFYTLTVVKSYDTAEEFLSLQEGEKGIIGFDLVVTYVNGQSCYAQTFVKNRAADVESVLVYGTTPYAAGDVIPAGWEGQYAPYSGLPEIKPVGDMPASVEKMAVPAPVELTEITPADVNKFVVLKKVKISEATPDGTAAGYKATNYNVELGGNTVIFRNNFKLASVEPGNYTVEGYVARYKTNKQDDMQVYPTKFTLDTTGIEGVAADDANAPVEFFNLQGVRVANPENGLFIRRQGNKVEKVVIR